MKVFRKVVVIPPAVNYYIILNAVKQTILQKLELIKTNVETFSKYIFSLEGKMPKLR